MCLLLCLSLRLGLVAMLTQHCYGHFSVLHILHFTVESTDPVHHSVFFPSATQVSATSVYVPLVRQRTLSKSEYVVGIEKFGCKIT